MKQDVYYLRLIAGLILAACIVVGISCVPIFVEHLPIVKAFDPDPAVQAAFLRQLADTIIVSLGLIIPGLLLLSSGPKGGFQG